MDQYWKTDKYFSDDAIYLLEINIIVTESEHKEWLKTNCKYT